MLYTTCYTSPVGRLLLAGDEKNLTGLWLEGQKYFGSTLPEKTLEKDDAPALKAAVAWLDRYFAGDKPASAELPLAPAGSVFRREVWRILCEIPYGEVVTYGEIARKIAHSRGNEDMSAQAVGGAVGHNPISIIIPCHRVVGADGSLTGYAGGVGIKSRLLIWEGGDANRFHMPSAGTAL